MDAAARDFQNYQLARQLHLLPQLYEVFLSNSLCYPLFYESLHPAVKRLARTLLLSLSRCFVSKASSVGEAAIARRYQVDCMRLILSFLEFPEYQLERGNCVSRLLHIPNGASGSETPTCTTSLIPQDERETDPLMQGVPPPKGSVHTTPIKQALQQEGDSSANVASGGASPSVRPGKAPAAAPVSDGQGIRKPLFFLRPEPVAAPAKQATLVFGTTTNIYVRMVHPHLLNEESLNPFFGRYGQVDVTALQRVPISECLPEIGETAMEALQQRFPSAEVGGMLYVQDFIISVDSHQNALHAVRRAYYKELVCIALHDAVVTGNNTHCLADVNAWMRRHPFVWRMRADPRVSIAQSGRKGAGAHSVSPVEKRRKRARAEYQEVEREKHRRMHTTKHAAGSSDSSAPAPPMWVNKDKPYKAKEARASSTSSSGSSQSSYDESSSQSDSAQDDMASFVPDVLLDGFPYWTTEDQLKVLLQDHGSVTELRLSVDDLSGAFTGCALVRMASVAEALAVSKSLHNASYYGSCITCGVVNERLEVVALEDANEVRKATAPNQIPYDVSVNERVWV